MYGPNPNNPGTGAYVYEGGFITFQGDVSFGNSLAKVTQTAKKGSKRVVVRQKGAGLCVPLRGQAAWVAKLVEHCPSCLVAAGSVPHSVPTCRLPQLAQVPSPPGLPAQVDTPAAIKEGEYYDLLYTDVDGKFNNMM